MMKTYTIGEVEQRFGLSKPTLRYYDEEGLIPNLTRDKNGNRIFNVSNINTIQSIECLKKTGMPIKEIKAYVRLIQEGDSTLEKRFTFFKERERIVQEQIKELNSTLDEIKWKCDYYQEAIEDGTEKNVKARVEASNN